MALFVAVEASSFRTLLLGVFRKVGWGHGTDTAFRSSVFVPGTGPVCTCVHCVSIRGRHLDSQDFGELLQSIPLLLSGVPHLWLIMHCPKVLHCCVILVVLANGIGPINESLGSVDFVDVIHHVEGEFGCKEGEGWGHIQWILRFMGHGFELRKEDVHLIRSHEKVGEAHLRAFPSTGIPEGVFKSMDNSSPIVFVIGGSARGVLINGPVGPPLYPILDIRSLDES
jgi:hypothetical protein